MDYIRINPGHRCVPLSFWGDVGAQERESPTTHRHGSANVRERMDTVHATLSPPRAAHQSTPVRKAGYSVAAFAKAIDLSRECIYLRCYRSVKITRPSGPRATTSRCRRSSRTITRSDESRTTTAPSDWHTTRPLARPWASYMAPPVPGGKQNAAAAASNSIMLAPANPTHRDHIPGLRPRATGS